MISLKLSLWTLVYNLRDRSPTNPLRRDQAPNYVKSNTVKYRLRLAYQAPNYIYICS